jgi:hypothetical protein
MEHAKRATNSALNFLDISEEDYINSFKNVMTQAEYRRVAEQIEKEVRDKLEPVKPLDKSKDEYKKIYCEMLQLEAKADVDLKSALAKI